MILQTEFSLLETAELIRCEADETLENRERFAQYLTPAPVARLMASMIDVRGDEIRLLDPGAGTGILTAAAVGTLCGKAAPPSRIVVTAFEIDPTLRPSLNRTLKLCSELCRDRSIDFDVDLLGDDFIAFASRFLTDDLFSAIPLPQFNLCIMNPPYQKILAASDTSRTLARIGVTAANLYSAFLELGVGLLEAQGQLIAITPRSFCNGSYFAEFRRNVLRSSTVKRIHLFESRTETFEANNVLQENIILSCQKGLPVPGSQVLISSSDGPELRDLSTHEVGLDRVVDPSDAEKIIHIELSEAATHVTELMRSLPGTLSDLGLKVSTGPVVDFRLQEYLLEEPTRDSAPLLYAVHFHDGSCRWPVKGKKPNAIVVNQETKKWLMPCGNYVVLKRFSSKEEKKRVVASIVDESQFPSPLIGFENHLNVIHSSGRGLEQKELALGLRAYLNSTLVDSYFRLFSGHTQVNAGDIRRLPFPSRSQLTHLGNSVSGGLPQEALDIVVNSTLFERDEHMAKRSDTTMKRAKKVGQALQLLKDMDFPREQQNDRTAYALLALAGLTPDKAWSKATAVPLGITPIMEFIDKEYGKKYAPNTRETIRRFSVHQMIQAHFLICNPDKSDRPPNSPKTIYQLESQALELIRNYGSTSWQKCLVEYRQTVVSLREEYEKAREGKRIPVKIKAGHLVSLSPGGQNVLVKNILDDFVPFFTPNAHVIYVGDTDQKFAFFEETYLKTLGVVVDKHGKMPDVIVHFKKKNWLVLIEAVTSHGPISPKRRIELQDLFRKSKAGLVYVTAFTDRRTMTKYLRDISWATEVWVAESPTHLIHFNGDRFLGPYQD